MSDALQQPDSSVAFTAMAAKIELNADGGFAGAFVIVAPDGTTQSMLFLDSSPDQAMFWAAVQTKAGIALAEIDQAQRGGGIPGFGRR